jgi:UDP-N-acetylglucosamine 2-epimerase (non-hydrolysing)
MKIHLIGAARPNFMKIAPLYHELKKHNKLQIKLIHTGQHYDKNMSESFFKDFNLPNPNFYLSIGGGSQAEQVGKTMIAYEKVLLKDSPDLIIVVGDVNATMACSITAKKLNIKVAHLEAGIRSFDMGMPEEINRKVTDSIVDYFWTPSIEANENLIREGISSNQIKLVGNIMIDSFEMKKDKIFKNQYFKELQVKEKNFVVATFHRPSNVDNLEKLEKLVKMLEDISEDIDIVFPLHPRTKKELEKRRLLSRLKNITLLEPLGYLLFMNLIVNCKFVLTDSGGIQEETTYLGIPCLTFRENTERPITISEGTNKLVDFDNYTKVLKNIMDKEPIEKSKKLIYWDGKTAERISEEVLKISRGET